MHACMHACCECAGARDPTVVVRAVRPLPLPLPLPLLSRAGAPPLMALPKALRNRPPSSRVRKMPCACAIGVGAKTKRASSALTSLLMFQQCHHCAPSAVTCTAVIAPLSAGRTLRARRRSSPAICRARLASHRALRRPDMSPHAAIAMLHCRRVALRCRSVPRRRLEYSHRDSAVSCCHRAACRGPTSSATCRMRPGSSARCCIGSDPAAPR
jgi:hypothetical protein